MTLCGMGPSLNNIKNDFVSQWVATMSGARPARLGRRSKIAQRRDESSFEMFKGRGKADMARAPPSPVES